MNPVQDKIDALRTFEQNLGANIRIIISSYDYVLLDLNIEDQLYERGVDRNNKEIASWLPYSPFTIRSKLFKQQPVDRVTLRDTGDFHRSFQLRVTDSDVEIYATDIKAEMLISKYGESILGLTDENLNEILWEYVYPELRNKLVDYLQ